MSLLSVVAISGLTAILPALVFLTGIMVRAGSSQPMPVVGAQATPAPYSEPPTQAKPTVDPPTPAPAPFATDDRGFVNSAARCDTPQGAVAIGRTQQSLLVICAVQNGGYEYRAVRLSDGAPLTAPAQASGGGFVVQNDGVTYAVSQKDLVITSDDTVIRREPMISYQQPRFPAEAGAAVPGPKATAPSTTASQPPG
jgi:hypothetical protein